MDSSNTSLTSSSSSSSLTPEQREVEQQNFAIAFEFALERIADGMPLDTFCREYNAPVVPLSPSRFRAWIYRSDKRRAAYHVAKAIGAEAVEDEMIRIADGKDALGNPTIDDVQRTRVMLETRRWLLGVWNRQRYGDKTTIEQNINTTTTAVDMTTDELRARLLSSLGLDEGALDV